MKFSKKSLILISLIITFIFTYDLIANIHKPISIASTDQADYALHLLIVKNTLNSVLYGNFRQILTLPIFYGVSGSIAFSDTFFIQYIFYLPIYLVTQNIIFTYNLVVVLNFLLSFLSMFALTFYLSKRFSVSIVSSTIFAFNPFIMARYPTAIEIHALFLIPLVFLYLEKSLKNPTSKNVFLFFLLLSSQLISGLYYFVFLSIFLPIYLLARIFQEKMAWMRFFNKGFVAGLLLFLIISAALGSIYVNFYSQESIARDANAAIYYSAKPQEFLTSQSPRNFFYNYIRSLTNIPKTSTNFEHHVFLGYALLIILLVGLVICFKKRKIDHVLVLFLFLALLSLILSLGPKFLVYDLFVKVDLLLSFIRAPSRFVVFFFCFASLSIAMIWPKLFNKNSLKEKFIFVIFFLVIILEYFNLPVSFSDIPSQTRQFYEYIDLREDIKVIAELPMGTGLEKNDDTKIIYLDGPYLLFAATLHSKKLLNGYSGYIPQDYAQKLKLFNTGVLDKQKLAQVKEWGVDAIVLHKDIFRNAKDFDLERKILASLEVKEIKTTDSLSLFDLTDWQPE